MTVLLRVAAAYSLLWAAVLAFPAVLPGMGAPAPAVRSLEWGLAVANLAFAYVFHRGAAAPAEQRGAIYAALLLFGLRGAIGTYEVLYALNGPAAMPRLVDMVLSLALFVGVLNSLPAALERDRAG